jgi:hypothetical protein
VQGGSATILKLSKAQQQCIYNQWAACSEKRTPTVRVMHGYTLGISGYCQFNIGLLQPLCSQV